MSEQASGSQLIDSVYYAAVVVTIGPDPDRPGRWTAATFHALDVPQPDPALVAEALRDAATDLEDRP
ncbi:hypothetical protein [Nocardia wallacei]|uniref:hypothetical protein n=1 Tax=Nocardia wallacei TaxID=480035 RepID=UPI0024569F6D|nr:hypothetical protein [Nocardia wallacei]